MLLLVANGAPVLAYDLFEDRWSWPVDGRRGLGDGQRILGESCTWRGWGASIGASIGAAWLLGLSWSTGLVVALAAMVGDSLSSFLKRRCGLPSGSRVLGVDQIPESLLPLLALRSRLDLDWLDILLGVIGFGLLELLISQVAFRLGWRKHPY